MRQGNRYVYDLTCIDCQVSWRHERVNPRGRRPPRCPPCHRKYWNAYQVAWAAKNRAQTQAAKRKWRLANPEKMQAARDTWVAAQLAQDPERFRESRRESRRKAKKNNPVANRAATKRRIAILKQLTVIDFTEAQVAERMAYFGNRCWMCGVPFECIDHVKPLAKGGAHMLCNLRPACIACNSRKHASWPPTC